MDRLLVSGAVLLLIIQVSFLFADLRGVITGPFMSHDKPSSTSVIGEMISTENQVRRKNQGSLFWDESRRSDELYEYDSLLTLSGSSAQVKLGQGSTLKLDENTLVVLEPSQNSKSGGIHLRFSRGTLRSKNSTDPIHLQSESFQMDIAANSEISFVSLQDGTYALEVEKGNVKVESASGETQTIEQGEKVKIQESEIRERRVITENLKFSSSLPKRLYTKTFPIEVDITWHGNAERLWMIHPDKSEQVVSLGESLVDSPGKTEAQSTVLQLREGTHLLSLENQSQSSESFALQVRLAPEFSYFSPLPRDRVQANQNIQFTWQPLSYASSYRVELSRDPEFSSLVKKIETKKPQTQTHLSDVGSHYWRVIALDEDQTEIPAPRSYPLYIEPQPLQAPTLQAPTIRVPAEAPSHREGASLLWHFLIPRSQAQAQQKTTEQTTHPTTLRAVFSWTEVSGADHYIIEISTTPGFENPLVIERVETTEFIWIGFEPGRYFWRVAGGRSATENTSEQKGLFSSPGVAVLERNQSTPNSGVVVEEVALLPTPTPTPAPQPTPLPVPLKDLKPKIVRKPKPPGPKPTPAISDRNARLDAAKIPEPKPPTEKIRRAQIESQGARFNGAMYYHPVWRLTDSKNDSDIHGRFAGPIPLALSSELRVISPNQTAIEANVSFSRTDWEPKSKTELPFQKSLTDTRWQGNILYRPTESRWAFGLGVDIRSLFVRVASEEGSLQSETLFGPSAHFTLRENHSVLDFGINTLFGSDLYGARLTVHWSLRLFEWGKAQFLIGPTGQLSTISGGEDQSLFESEVGVKIGIGW